MFQSFKPLDYLRIDVANNFGLDKLSWDDRIQWFNDNEQQLGGLVKQAKEPALFYAGTKAFYDALNGKPIGYMVSLDATASGLQLLAALTGDRKAASLCNVIDSGNREDAYRLIYEEMCHEIGDTSKIAHADVKQAIMTSLYGSRAVPKQVFGEGELLKIFYDTMQELAPAAWELNEAFISMWDHETYEHSWILPDNHHVEVKVMDQVRDTVHFLNEPFDVFYNVNRPTKEGRSLGANTIHSIDGMIVREITRRCDYDQGKIASCRKILDKAKSGNRNCVTKDDRMVITLWEHFQYSGYLSMRIVDYLDAGNVGHVDTKVVFDLLDSLPAKPFKVVSIHDCFRCLPHYANDLRHQYNLQLKLIAQSNMLGALVSQIIGEPIKLGKLDPKLHLDIMETNYALS